MIRRTRLCLRLLPALLAATLLSACVETQPLQRVDSLRVDTQLSGIPKPNDDTTRTSLKNMVALQDRIDHVVAPLLVKNQDMCRNLARPILGFTAKNKYSYSAALADTAHEALGLGEMLQVTGVMAGTGAARSGLQRGDALVAAGNKPMPQGPNAEYEAPEVLLPLILGQSSVKLSVLRSGKSVSISVPLTKACAFRVDLGNADNINSYTDGRRIMVTRGMMKFVRSDHELAYVIAREMAHNALNHPARNGSASAARDVINSLMPLFPYESSAERIAGIKPMPKEMDVLADQLALHMLMRAGYPIDGAPAFWQRLVQQVPASVTTGHTALHPNTSARQAALAKVIGEIQSRRQYRKK